MSTIKILLENMLDLLKETFGNSATINARNETKLKIKDVMAIIAFSYQTVRMLDIPYKVKNKRRKGFTDTFLKYKITPKKEKLTTPLIKRYHAKSSVWYITTLIVRRENPSSVRIFLCP
ncbi:hypothetical protein ACFQO1_11805 [Jejudonia soesokkakensis]|uniref:Transposase n=1 Tax=Jejudonia soesokkakensis TaxID=1323432 RepID=A0ABW2MXA8_9FLAO